MSSIGCSIAHRNAQSGEECGSCRECYPDPKVEGAGSSDGCIGVGSRTIRANEATPDSGQSE